MVWLVSEAFTPLLTATVTPHELFEIDIGASFKRIAQYDWPDKAIRF